MIILYATKLDANGNIYKLQLDTDKKQYTTEPSGFFHRSDAVTVTKKELRKIRQNAIKEGYTAKTF